MYVQPSTIPGVGVAAVLVVCVALSGVTWAKNGPLEKNPGQLFDEILGQIGILNDTMHAFPGRGRTGLCDEPSVGEKQLHDADRFVTALNGGAYCDQKTGLVWERFPAGGFFDWAGAISHCATLQVGGWKGWSLPMREQLASLVDINSVLCIGGGLCLPDGHPFQNVQSGGYWSASTTAGSPTFAWLVNFFFGSALVMNVDGKGFAWCVRGGQSSDGQDLAAIE
jgi:Protein of unknown function (DUF1566)